MHLIKSFTNKLFPSNEFEFEKAAIEIFHYQFENNKIYNDYVVQRKIDISKIRSIQEIPFLPISFFKSNIIKTGKWSEEKIFESSGTTGQINSKKYVRSLNFYQNHSMKIFEKFFGDPSDYHIMALLPSYLERDNSSLIYMVKSLIEKSKSQLSGFYLDDFEKLREDLQIAKNTDKRIILLGVTFALLDFLEYTRIDLEGHIIMETGGMKGRRRELIREELHEILCNGFNVEGIHSEYGMTELYSQAYSFGNGLYKTPDSMRVLLRDLYDPLTISNNLRQGGINVVDLANYSTCSFIETQDIGRRNEQYFEVIGRFDSSDVRGCNLMV